MAASIQRLTKTLYSLSPSLLRPLRQYQSCVQRLPVRPWPSAFIPPHHSFCKAASLQDEDAADAAEAAEATEAVEAVEAVSRYKDRPWDYLESEEYIEKYGTNTVWAGYRRNHKGGIPPQKTRKTCIRGDKICGNPCPICRDPNVIIHHQNVKLLQQFISPHTGLVFDPTRTGVCMKQQKNLNKAIDAARDHGFLPFQIPFVEFSGEDFNNSHDAVGSTPPASFLTSGDTWYKWYGEVTPDESEVAKVKKKYKAYLK
ncbi:28S ribosomal protein S18b, mitochondrial [Seriola lalandi dorsalis]|uniref:28S ribosomal protein S18b, mitochondrial n=1 Tax=Seriola lalandi dorsalis TaxID=1841481 RepID=UPI000C6FA67A|nr:28S ribosomal protein S18b, mitochondrial [Seriola lalandi dorsalis]